MKSRQHASASRYQVLTPIEAKIVGALGQTMYPREGGVAIDATAARAVEYVDRWLTLVPAKERALLRLMFVLFEISMPVFGPARTRRFSRADPQAQYEYLSSWETSTIYFRRASMYGLRSVFALAYLGDEEVLRQVGVEPGPEVLRRQRAAAHMDDDPTADVTALADAVDELRRRVSGGES